jgi:DNA-binding response OmpR family regulator
LLYKTVNLRREYRVDLIVDDDVLSVKLTTFVLKEAGYCISTMPAKDATPEAIYERNPNVLLLEVALSHTSGFEICRQLRAISDLPIIFLSTYASLHDRVAGLRLGADDYIAKPFEPTELLARVTAVLRRCSNMVQPPSHVIGDEILLDTVQQTVTLPDGRIIALTPVEFRLLHCLIASTGQVLSQEQLLEKVWGCDGATASNQVAVYIRRLRNKLEPDTDWPQYIITEPGSGYMFQLPRNTLAIGGGL